MQKTISIFLKKKIVNKLNVKLEKLFLFKGNRSYLHSTDIIDFIEKNYKYN